MPLSRGSASAGTSRSAVMSTDARPSAVMSARPSVSALKLLHVLCALWVLAALSSPPVVTAQRRRDISTQDMMTAMRTVAEIPAEERREAMQAVANRDMCTVGTESNHTLDVPDACLGQHIAAWQAHVVKCSCQPRETLVSLHDADTPHMTMPSVALVNRCSGWCSTMGHSCMPARTEIRAVTLLHHDNAHHQMLCGAVRVPEDVKCTCACPLTAANCTEKQEFRADLCMCRCRKSAEFRRGCSAGHRWDARWCRCVCSERRECSSGLGWSDELCRCLPMVMPQPGEVLPPSDDENSVRYK